MTKTIDFREIETIPQLIKDFLNGEIEGFQNQLFNIQNVENQIQQKGKSYTAEQREILCEVLKKQLSCFQLSEKQQENLNAISEQNTFTIVTGHQLNLFSGPAFFIYKILQTIKTAEVLKQRFPNQNFVPVFWMATEDHDFEEINHFKTAFNYYEMKAQSGGAVGRIKVEDVGFIQDFEDEFKDSIFGTELIRIMKEAYKIGETLADSTKILVQYLFSEYGLLILDGDDVRLKSQMKTIFREELLEQQLFNSTREIVGFLEEKYSKVQVNPREINLFYLSETRNRIEFQNGIYKVVDTEIQFTQEEVLKELDEYPEKFSPNALMRPVYQESVLPNIAYIGGNAEVMYWLELRDYFKNLALPFPVLIPRNSMLFLTSKILAKIEKLNLKIEDFFGNFSKVIAHALMSDNEIASMLEEKEAELKNSFSEIKSESEKTEKTFKNLVEAEETRQLKSFARMKKRLLRAEKIKQQEKLQRLEELFLQVHPAKVWQERVYNFSVFYSDSGREWLQNCYQNMDVDNSELIIMAI